MDKPGNSAIKYLWILFAASTLVRLFLASQLELSVDESYYWLYALYPDWSHFDHPPMVGFTIQLFSLNLLFDSEWILRLGPVVISAFNTVLAYRIGLLIKDSVTGLYAAMLYTSSIYLSVLAGVFIIPDAPQTLFWMLALHSLIHSLPSDPIERAAKKHLLLAGLFTGLAIYSKYHGIFIWAGALLYIIMFNRRWLRQPVLYLSGMISIVFIIPILYWNLQHQFISFGFHSGRVTPALSIHLEYFLREMGGQIAYNNPVNFFLIAGSLLAALAGKSFLPKTIFRVLILNAIPLWAVFTAFSLFRPTLPHWTGPAYTSMIFVAAAWLREKSLTTNSGRDQMIIPSSLKWAVSIIGFLAILAIFVINYLPAGLGKKQEITTYGEGDFTQDMYGWRQVADGFLRIRNRDIDMGLMSADAPILTFRYFPASFYDYYFAYDKGINVLVPASPDKAHNYIWINEQRGGMKAGDDAYCLVVSNWYSDPAADHGPYFNTIEGPETFEITRSGVVVRYGLVYRLRGYKGNYDFWQYD